MNTQDQIGFITRKIQYLQTAIMHCHTNCRLKLPTTLAQTLFVDEKGYVWITVSRPPQYIHERYQHFHVALNYYKKGIPFFLNSFGIARVISDPEELNQIPENLKEHYNKEKLVLCVRILEASYFDKEPKSQKGLIQKLKQSLAEMFYGNNDYFYFYPDDEKYFA